MKKNWGFIVFFLLCSSLYGQTHLQQLQSFVKNTVAFNKLCPQEKVYLHTDNNGYFMGETIWFKAYVVNASSLAYTTASQVVYVELLSPEGDIIDKRKLQVVDGQGRGEFVLEKVLNSGFYEIRAYTRSMLNWGNEVVFSRVIPIFNAPKKSGDYEKMVIDERSYSQRVPDNRVPESEEKLKKLNLRFFPEGGYSVVGLSGKVAFQATDKTGRWVNIQGELYNDKGEALELVSAVHQGRGVFEYLPDGGEYTVKVKYDDRNYEFVLPEAKPKGYNLTVNAYASEKIQLLIQQSEGMPNLPLGITIMCRGSVCFFDTLNLSAGQILLSFPKESFPAGVNQITIFDAKGEVFAERLIFIPPVALPILSVRKNEENYSPYSPVVLEMTLNDAIGNPIETTFSLTVRDRDSESNARLDNVATELLLTSDIKGYVDNPEYYFEKDDRTHRLAADLLMMVQGWRRYEWQQMAGLKPFEIKQPIEEGLLIDGAVLSTGRKQERAGVQLDVTLYNSQLGVSMKGSCITDSAGKYAFYPEPFNDQWTMYMKTLVDGKAKNHRITLNRGFSPVAQALSPYAVQLNDVVLPVEDETPLFEWHDTLPPKQWDNVDLPEVEVTAKRKMSPRSRWENEERGLSVANIYYNVEQEVESLLDKGQLVSDIYTWLRDRNKYFDFALIPHYEMESVVNKGSRVWVAEQSSNFRNDQAEGDYSFDNEKKIALKDKSATSVPDDVAFEIAENYKKALDYGLRQDFYICTYKGRRVILVVNNRYLDQGRDGIAYSNILAEDVKSVVICEKENPLSDFEIPSVDRNRQYVVVFIYLQPNRSLEPAPKGVRRTYFQGYSTPKEFYSPNYRELPSSADFRRTLYWNPDVKTDAQGKASVLFFNNSVCKSLVINAEGVTSTGVPIVYK